MVSLNFDDEVFDGPTDAAFFLEGFGEFLELRQLEGQACNGCDVFSATDFAAESSNAITGRRGLVLGASTSVESMAALGTHTAVFGGVDHSVSVLLGHSQFSLTRGSLAVESLECNGLELTQVELPAREVRDFFYLEEVIGARDE